MFTNRSVNTVQQQLNEQVILPHNPQDPHSCEHQDFSLLGQYHIFW